MQQIPLKYGDVVHFYWLDSRALDGWQSGREVNRLARIKTVGLVVETTTDGLTVSSSMVYEDGASADPITIPWGSITDLEVLPNLSID